jgi:DNA repair protein RadA/Sms
MTGNRQVYACIECGFESPKWMGKCTQCGSWGSFKRIVVTTSDSEEVRNEEKAEIEKVDLSKDKSKDRLKSGFFEFDRVLGGGVVGGEVILLGGEPGVGKTTLLLQLLNSIDSSKGKCVYVSSEESSEQLSIHAKRLGLRGSWRVICEGDIDIVLNTLKDEDLSLVIVDSIQTVKTDDLRGLPGGVGQVKECASRMVDFAKSRSVAVILIGHITKGGDLAGPKILEHIVDAVFYLEGDPSGNIRLIRSIKNRFGSTREIGVFSFGKKGFADVKDPSEAFILSTEPRIGVCKGVIFEGRRAILVEVQALISKSTFSLPQRVVSGIKRAKIQMLCALLSKFTKARLVDKDVYVNIANGLKVEDSSLDLAVCIALLSSYFEKKVNPKRVAIGEASLTGKIHSTGNLVDKMEALKRLGYEDVIVPEEFKGVIGRGGYIFCDSVSDVSKVL